MVRILHVVGKMHYGGMETLIMNIYRNIDRSKVQFDFLVHYKEAGEYDAEIRRLGGQIFVMPKTTPSNILILKKAYGDFFSRNHAYKFVHVHFRSIAFLIFPVAKKYGIQCILHIHTSGITGGIRGYLSLIATKIAVREADQIFACSKKAGEYFVKGSRKFDVVKNGINADRFYFNADVREKMRKKLGLEEKYVLICVARFDAKKNQKFLIDIINELKKKDINICLLLVGKGPLENKIRQQVKQLSLEKEVKFLGARADVNELMQAADCYVMPSLMEGLGNVYVEAQVSGLMTFASKEALVEEACITNLIEGISIKESAESWADRILNYKGCKRENQRAAIEKSGFEIEKVAEQMQLFYEGKAV
ncbi:MAG: glycosyltransferase [Butyrivibrio sp.]|nr:glycosyltransferase [Butyrivibrio sp.]